MTSATVLRGRPIFEATTFTEVANRIKKDLEGIAAHSIIETF